MSSDEDPTLSLSPIRDADWLDAGRIRRVCLILLIAYCAGIAALLATSHEGLDWKGRPLGTDFSNVWSAGVMAVDGRAAEAYDPQRQHAQQKHIFDDPEVPFYGWHYPPFFLALASILALVPYTLSWLVWMAATMPLYLAVLWQVLPGRLAILAGAAFPAVFINFTHGQNGFLTASLLGAGLLFLRRNETAAGMFLGLLAYKPQFGLLIPLALACGGYWRAFFSASVTVIGLVAVSLLLFGPSVWLAFVEFSGFTQTIVLEAGSTGWEKIQSLFSTVRMWGGGVQVAYTVQGLLAAACVGVVTWLWWTKVEFELRAAALIVCSLLATPYLMDYDLMALAMAIVFYTGLCLRKGFAPYEKSLLAAAWLSPLLTRAVAEYTLVPFSLILMLLMLALIIKRTHVAASTRPTVLSVDPRAI